MTETAREQVLVGDCRELLQLFDGCTVDAIVTDPPYGLGFMGKEWDHEVPGVPFWAEMLRVAKPGAYLAAFGGTRTFHRMACAIEDSGWELRDTLMWVYGSGFPKSHNGEWGGTALKPAWEPIILARKPLIGTVENNWRQHRTGALNIDGCRVGWPDGLAPEVGTPGWGGPQKKSTAAPGQDGETVDRLPPSPLGRWPANLIHDGSDEVMAAFPLAKGQQGRARTDGVTQGNSIYGALRHVTNRPEPRLDAGSAARFFYCAKASKRDRGDGNNHPTVKPTDLMRWLCRLVTPPGGLVLDPFTGSGSSGRGAVLEGFQFVGIELSAEYAAIAEARIKAAQSGLPLGDAA